jgi:HSP20 family molecular chaperone IbpA
MAIKKKRQMRDEIDEYRENVDEWIEQFEKTLLERPSWNKTACTIEPLRGVKVTATEVIVTADLPLTEEKAVQVEPLDDRTLEISAKMTRKVRFKELGIIHHEGEFHMFQCHTHIPVPVHMDKMKVKFKKGMLEIHLRRKHEQVALKGRK